MDYTHVVFLQQPGAGSPVRFAANGQIATTSPVAQVQTDPQRPGWFWVTTASGHAYVGQVQTEVTAYGQPTQHPAQPGQSVNVSFYGAPPYQQARPRKDKTSAGLLALLLGGLGVHKFYLDQSGLGLVYLLFCWTFIPAIISFVEAILFFTMNQGDFDSKYNGLRAY